MTAIRFVCTGRRTHPVAAAVNRGEAREGTWWDPQRPVLIMDSQNPRSAAEYRCDVCGRTLRLGERRRRRLRAGLAEMPDAPAEWQVDISLFP